MKTNIEVRLVGEDGNAYSILGRVRRAMQKAGRSDEWSTFEAEATSGDYDNLLATVLKWTDEPDDDDNDDEEEFEEDDD